MGLDPRFLLMKRRPDGKLAFQHAKGGLDLGKLHVLRPELLGGARRQVGPWHVRTFSQIPPGLAFLFDLPEQAYALRRLPQSDFEQVIDRRAPWRDTSAPRP